MTPHEAVSYKIASLQEALLSSHPSMPTLLREIRFNLEQDPEVVTLISPEERAIIVSGLMKQTATQITTSIMSSSSRGKSVKKMTVDDI